MPILTAANMQRRWPAAFKSNPALIAGITSAADRVFSAYGLDTPLAVAHFMAQVSEECGDGEEMVESLKYSAARLLEVFPSHFTHYTARCWQGNECMIGDFAYGGRMGNAKYPSNDGYTFRGRGLTQVTGRTGYEQLQSLLKIRGLALDIMSNPDIVCDPKYALECGVADFYICGCVPFAKRGDVLNVTKRLNGGINGLAERKRQLVLWKAELCA